MISRTPYKSPNHYYLDTKTIRGVRKHPLYKALKRRLHRDSNSGVTSNEVLLLHEYLHELVHILLLFPEWHPTRKLTPDEINAECKRRGFSLYSRSLLARKRSLYHEARCWALHELILWDQEEGMPWGVLNPENIKSEAYEFFADVDPHYKIPKVPGRNDKLVRNAFQRYLVIKEDLFASTNSKGKTR